MQSKVIFVVLIMLSFSAFHDSFFSILDNNKHTDVVHYMSDKSISSECTELNEIHSIFHFMAIISTDHSDKLQFVKSETIPHSIIHYTSPLEKTSYKPPIV
jgi:hypothetical protein